MVAFILKVEKWSSRAQISTFGGQKPKMVLTYEEASPPSYYNNAYVIVQWGKWVSETG